MGVGTLAEYEIFLSLPQAVFFVIPIFPSAGENPW